MFQIDHQLQNDFPSMPNDPARHLHHLPPKGSDALSDPRLRTRESFESNEKIVSQNAYPEKNRIGVSLPVVKLNKNRKGMLKK
jgi:hypothetical protein